MFGCSKIGGKICLRIDSLNLTARYGALLSADNTSYSRFKNAALDPLDAPGSKLAGFEKILVNPLPHADDDH